jgi:hypothetical protein
MFSSNREVDRCIFCGGHKEARKKISLYNFQSLNLILEVSAWIVIQATPNQESGSSVRATQTQEDD